MIASITDGTCANCSRSWGAGRSCQFCSQVEGLPVGVRLSTPAKRFGAMLLEILLAIVTLGIGYLIWSLIVYKNGQTPAKQIMGMRIVSLEDGAHSSWGRTFLREIIIKSIIGFVIGWTIVPYLWLLWDKDRQQLWDKMAGTVVVDDPNKQIQ